jgi:hypothetical protein
VVKLSVTTLMVTLSVATLSVCVSVCVVCMNWACPCPVPLLSGPRAWALFLLLQVFELCMCTFHNACAGGGFHEWRDPQVLCRAAARVQPISRYQQPCELGCVTTGTPVNWTAGMTVNLDDLHTQTGYPTPVCCVCVWSLLCLLSPCVPTHCVVHTACWVLHTVLTS